MSIPLVLRLPSVMVLWSLWFRLIAVGLDLAPRPAFLKRRFPQGGRNWAIIGLIGIGSTALGFLGMFHAAEFVSPGTATVIADAQPILAALLAAGGAGGLLHRHRSTAPRGRGLALGGLEGAAAGLRRDLTAGIRSERRPALGIFLCGSVMPRPGERLCETSRRTIPFAAPSVFCACAGDGHGRK